MSSSRPRPPAAFSLFDVTELRPAERRWEREATTERLGRDGKNLFPRAFPLKALVLVVLRENTLEH